MFFFMRSRSPSIFFFSLRASFLLRVSASSELCRSGSSSIGSLNIHHEIFDLILQPLLSSLDGISLIFGSPLSHLRVGLGETALQLSLSLLFLLVLLSQQLLLHSLQVVNLLSQISHTVSMFLPQGGTCSLMLQSGLFKVSTQLLEFCLPLLVHLNLSGCGPTSLLQPLTDLLQLSGQVIQRLLVSFLEGLLLLSQLGDDFVQSCHFLCQVLHLSFLRASDLAYASLSFRNSSFMLAISFSASADLSKDPDALQHTVTAQLVHDQRILHGPWSLGLIGDDASHKVRSCMKYETCSQEQNTAALLTLSAVRLCLLLSLLLLEPHVAIVHDGTVLPDSRVSRSLCCMDVAKLWRMAVAEERGRGHVVPPPAAQWGASVLLPISQCLGEGLPLALGQKQDGQHGQQGQGRVNHMVEEVAIVIPQVH
ncbi:hypothetical protein JZ751_003874 [Albula glossodonta]|uniref:Uncharacterized protein n=1 Tax=Albula glossodonta TaxID=121402 RepID=A0A8T2PED6_9TELE|nr:hypothetical protein JZ751_003874 [Albula glossodonta]